MIVPSTVPEAQEAPTPTVAALDLVVPQAFAVEEVTLGRQPNNDGDNSGAMWFE